MVRIRMMGCIAFILASATLAQTTAKSSIVTIESLEAKLETRWKSGQWSDESVALMKVVWEDFKKSRNKVGEAKGTRSMANLGTPHPKDMEAYVGQFAAKEGRREGELLEISKHDGSFVVKVQGQELPATIWNKCILFTTGDVVVAQQPSFGGKSHGTLEFLVVCCVNEKFYFLNLADPYRAMELAKR